MAQENEDTNMRTYTTKQLGKTSHAGECDDCDDCDAVEAEPECSDGPHAWTAEGLGGCDENPGVWSHGGTKMTFEHRCILCGCTRKEVSFGSQRDPGQCDKVRYDATGAEVDDDERAQALEDRRRAAKIASRPGLSASAMLAHLGVDVSRIVRARARIGGER